MYRPVLTLVALYLQEQQASWHLSEGGLAYQNPWQGSARLLTATTLPRGRCSRDTGSVPGRRRRDESEPEALGAVRQRTQSSSWRAANLYKTCSYYLVVFFFLIFLSFNPLQLNKLKKKNPVHFLFFFAPACSLTGFIQQVRTAFADKSFFIRYSFLKTTTTATYSTC